MKVRHPTILDLGAQVRYEFPTCSDEPASYVGKIIAIQPSIDQCLVMFPAWEDGHAGSRWLSSKNEGIIFIEGVESLSLERHCWYIQLDALELCSRARRNLQQSFIFEDT